MRIVDPFFSPTRHLNNSSIIVPSVQSRFNLDQPFHGTRGWQVPFSNRRSMPSSWMPRTMPCWQTGLIKPQDR